MLDSALGFERLVKNPKTGSKESGGKTQVTWDNPLELEAYIDKLQAAADKLTSENRRLRKCHYNISDKVWYLLHNSACFIMKFKTTSTYVCRRGILSWPLLRTTTVILPSVTEHFGRTGICRKC